MKSELEIYLQAEFAATQQLLVGTLSTVLKLVERSGSNREAVLTAHLEAGLTAIDGIDFWDIPQEQKDSVTELAKARYTALVSNLMR